MGLKASSINPLQPAGDIIDYLGGFTFWEHVLFHSESIRTRRRHCNRAAESLTAGESARDAILDMTIRPKRVFLIHSSRCGLRAMEGERLRRSFCR